MARAAAAEFVCQACGSASPKWLGQCPDCGGWNTLSREASVAPLARGGVRARKAEGAALELLATADDAPQARLVTGLTEFDRAVGGGLARGSAVLIGGEPGIGKSTLVLQLAAKVAQAGGRALYFSGEEATRQIRLRAERLGIAGAPVGLAAETHVERILATIAAAPADLVIIDSIQTLWSEAVDAAPGTVSQVRAGVQALVGAVKAGGATLILIGHVTKDGQIAGPKVVEHMVDTVLAFEGDSGRHFRLLRALKNRFGPAGELGVFEMGGTGLAEVANPSALFLGERDSAAPGAAVFAGIEGTRAMLVEFQALIAPSPFAAPRRAVVGWDASRLAMLIAVLESRCGVKFGQADVYLNVAGGLRITEPAADLAAAAALISAQTGVALGARSVYFGEVSLSGAVRAVPQMEARLREAGKLGFPQAHMPKGGDAGEAPGRRRVEHLSVLVAEMAARRGAVESNE